jgi:predicted transcriptional regulator
MNTQAIEFLTANPKSNKGQIADAINLRGLGLFNLLKSMVKEGKIAIEGEGHDVTYSVSEAMTEKVESDVQPIVEEAPNTKETTVETAIDPTTEPAPINEETSVQTAEIQTEQVVEKTPETKAATKAQSGRNTGTYKFNGTSYNKGKLIHAVVAAQVSRNKNITHDKLKAAFPDTLLKRFGIFQTVEKGREISGAKYDRYFFKEEMQIKLKDAVVVTCNQITGENILPFLEACAKLGYVIEAE